MQKAMIDGHLYMKTMGQYFKIRLIAQSEKEANIFCENNKDVSVIAENKEHGLIYIANNAPYKPVKL